MKKKAYKIKTKADIDINSWGIYGAYSAPRAKTLCMSSLWESYPNSNYSWITSCRRAPEYDDLVNEYSGCVAWKQGAECWEQDKGHWYEN